MMLALVLCLAPLSAQAASTAAEMSRYPNVTISPDGSGQAWTTDYKDKTNERLEKGYTIDTGMESSLRALNPGEHYYAKDATGSVPIGKWVVTHSPGQCIHDNVVQDTFAGFTYSNSKCMAYYNNGWFAYCADCGEEAAHLLIYGRKSTMEKITSIPATSTYVYICPHCDHLEQGHRYQHVCKGISHNRYRVTYRANAPADSAAMGYMAPTLHMYDNAALYNGQDAAALGYGDRKLRKNTYSCEGYLFAGWNTEADGSGTFYADGQEVMNLTTQDQGIVRLYAQWTKCESSLRLDAGGGTYKGKAVYEQIQKYGSAYTVDNGSLKAPVGHQVTFVTNGGSAVGAITTKKVFSYWQPQEGFDGLFVDGVYTYQSPDGDTDTLLAVWGDAAFSLPDCTRSNQSLVGWYTDPGLSEEAYFGKPGDRVTVSKETTLYAKWAGLTLWAYDDYESHGGMGAVDLSWEQKDGKSKYYRLYQSADQVTWKTIYSGNETAETLSVSKTYTASQQGSTYTIPYTGYYTLQAKGAKGADYSDTLTGGKGASVTASFWLKEGDIVTFYAGTAGNGQDGGTNGSGADGGNSDSDSGRGGGAATQIYVTRNGSRTLLLTAGGGGGANAGYSGGAGGSGGNHATSNKGADGAGGGGGGVPGGAGGAFVSHEHDETVCGYHNHLGNTTSGGECYQDQTQSTAICGSTFIEPGPCRLWWDAANNRCKRCHGTDPNFIHNDRYCASCGMIVFDYQLKDGMHIVTKTVYALSCTLEEGYQCGMTEGAADGHKPSYGGSSYISTEFSCRSQKTENGVNDGNGSASLVSEVIGYLENTRLEDVPAKDMAAPEKIPGYDSGLIDVDVLRIHVQEPKDRGTLYYHKAESYAEGSSTLLAESNITANTLTSGIQGYRYYVDTKSTGTVTASHTLTQKAFVDVEVKTTDRYLHVAAVDVAGNIGPTMDIKVPAEPEDDIEEEYIKKVPPMTEKLRIELTDTVYEKDTDVYYVKADGTTVHSLKVAGFLTGEAKKDYQVDHLRLVSSVSGTEEWYQLTIPRTTVDAGDSTFSNAELLLSVSKEELDYLIPAQTTAARTDQAAKVTLQWGFTIGAQQDGKTIVVYPRALAEFEQKTYFSDENADKGNRITLIPDAKAPVITGMDALEDAGNLDMTEDSKTFVITATDAGSGIRELTVVVTNLDNHMTRTYSSDTGEVTITVEKEDYLFLGDFVVSASAVDHVSNQTLSGSDKLAFMLEAKLERTREPYDGDFKAGDGARLTVTTGGYADKVIIRFPEELLVLNPELNRVYVYDFPEAIKTEVYEFNLPLGTLPGTYVIEIEAWKNGEKLTEELQLPVRTDGSITEELRTRIRDNGV